MCDLENAHGFSGFHTRVVQGHQIPPVKLRLSQSEFGKRLKHSAMAVSRWERSEQPPYGQLLSGKVAGRSFGWLFWNLAGITEHDIQ